MGAASPSTDLLIARHFDRFVTDSRQDISVAIAYGQTEFDRTDRQISVQEENQDSETHTRDTQSTLTYTHTHTHTHTHTQTGDAFALEAAIGRQPVFAVDDWGTLWKLDNRQEMADQTSGYRGSNSVPVTLSETC